MQPSNPRTTLLAETDWLVKHLNDPSLRIVDIRGIVQGPGCPAPALRRKPQGLPRGAHPGGGVRRLGAGYRAAGRPGQDDGGRAGAIRGSHGATRDRQSAHRGHLRGWRGADRGSPVVGAELLRPPCRPSSSTAATASGWQKAGRSRAELPRHPPATFTPRIQPEWRVGSADVRAAIGDPATVVLDLRSPREYRGEIGRGDRKGRIPGARNLPAGTLVGGEHKTFNSEAELRQAFEAAGVTFDKRAITYCNAGVSASLGLFALKLIGHPAATNFAGSWYEWERDPQNPTETG